MSATGEAGGEEVPGESGEALSKRMPDTTEAEWLKWYDAELTKILMERS